MLSKSLIQFPFDGRGYVPSLLFDLRPNYPESNEDNGNFLQKIPCMHCHTQCPNPAAGHHRLTPLSETPGHAQASLGQSLVGSLLLSSWVLVHTRFCLYPLRICFPSPVLSSIIKSTGLQSQILWEFSIPLPDPQVGKSVVDPRTFLTV